MARTAKSYSVSFDPALFEQMEERMGSLRLNRSEYITQLVMRDMLRGGELAIPVTPVVHPTQPKKRR